MAGKRLAPTTAKATDAWEVVDATGKRHVKGTYDQAAAKFDQLAHDNMQTARYAGLTLRRVPTSRR